MVRFNERPIGTIAFDEDIINGGGNAASDGFSIPRDKPIRIISQTTHSKILDFLKSFNK